MRPQPRVLDERLRALTRAHPAVRLEGARGVGVSAWGRRHAASVVDLADPAVRALVAGDPERLWRGRSPVFLDRYDLAGDVDALVTSRLAHVDGPGAVLLGAASTADAPAAIPTLRLRPLTLGERGGVPPTVSLARLLSGERPDVEGYASVDPAEYQRELVAGGLPGLRSSSTRAQRAAQDAYLQRALGADLAALGWRARRPASLAAWLRAYAAETARPTSFEAIRDRCARDGHPLSRATADGYRHQLARALLLDELPAWTPPSRVRLAGAAKHHLVDPALAARLLGVSESGRDLEPVDAHRRFAALFESLVTSSLRTWAQAHGATVAHLRTQNDRQRVDLVVVRADGRALGVRVLFAPVVWDHDVADLHWFARTFEGRALDLLVVHTGHGALRRRDGVAVVPLALLGP